MPIVPLPVQLASLEQTLIALRLAGINMQTWLTVAKHLKTDALARLIEAVKDPRTAVFFNQNLEEKKKAVQKNDWTAWEKILKEEKEFVGALD